MDTQLRLITPDDGTGDPEAPSARRRRSAPPVRRGLSAETRRIGRAGVAAARAELERANAARAGSALRRAS